LSLSVGILVILLRSFYHPRLLHSSAPCIVLSLSVGILVILLRSFYHPSLLHSTAPGIVLSLSVGILVILLRSFYHPSLLHSSAPKDRNRITRITTLREKTIQRADECKRLGW
jgi:hypothetical protein